TGMDTRIGYPNEHLAGDSDEEVASPLYATAVGLLMNAIKNQEKLKLTQEEILQEQQLGEEEELVYANQDTEAVARPNLHKERKSVFDKWSEKLKEFLDNAE
ncbi:MAG: cell division protein FtsA, partial [Maribacter sp.]